MTACAVLNMGTPDMPGHADDTAVLAPLSSAAYALLTSRATTGAGLKQRDAAEFLEDLGSIAHVIYQDDQGEAIPAGRAVSAIRNITIQQGRKQDTVEKTHGATRSAFESLQASSADTLPAIVVVQLVPYLGIAERVFSLRLGVITSDPPQVTLRIVNQEQHAQDMAAELAELVRAAMDGVAPVVVGSYKRGA